MFRNEIRQYVLYATLLWTNGIASSDSRVQSIGVYKRVEDTVTAMWRHGSGACMWVGIRHPERLFEPWTDLLSGETLWSNHSFYRAGYYGKSYLKDQTWV